MATEISHHIYSIPTSAAAYASRTFTPNMYLVRDNNQGIFIDSGFNSKQCLKARLSYLATQPKLQINHIILTHHHPDHSGGATQLRQATGAQIMMHKEEKPFIQNKQSARREIHPTVAVDHWLEDGDLIELGNLKLEVIHTPGHTLGSICLYFKHEHALFTGDSVLGVGTSAVMPPPIGDMSLYIHSLERLQGYKAALILPGHGPVVHQVQEKLQFLIDHRRNREDQIVSLIARGSTTAATLLANIYPDLEPSLTQMARFQIEAHLAKLIVEERICCRGDVYTSS